MKTLKYFIPSFVLLGMLAFVFTAHANPSFFYRSISASVATTTVTYMTPGTATSTEILDTGAGAAGSVDSGVLAVQFTGSSTLSYLNVAFEYTQGGNGLDCYNAPNSCDWYGSSLYAQSTSTATGQAVAAQNFNLQFASSSVQGAVGGITGRNLRLIEVKTPTRYVRAVFTLPPGSLNGALWKEFITKRQNP